MLTNEKTQQWRDTLGTMESNPVQTEIGICRNIRNNLSWGFASGPLDLVRLRPKCNWPFFVLARQLNRDARTSLAANRQQPSGV